MVPSGARIKPLVVLSVESNQKPAMLPSSAAVQGKIVNMNLGYSHPINYPIPDQIKVTVEENTKLTIEGPDRQVVGQVAAELRSFYPPEPYKGKGVRYVGEHVQRKEGKTVQ